MKSLEKALAILDYLEQEKRPLRLTDIANKLEISVSNAHKILSVFVKSGYAQQDKYTNLYSLGTRFLHMGYTMLNSIDVRTIARPYFKELSRKTNETINLMVRHGSVGMYAAIIESTSVARVSQVLGTTEPLHAGALGKALLAYLPEAEVQRIITDVGLAPITSNTITDPGILHLELQKIRSEGYAFDYEEAYIGVYSVATPIFDCNHAVVASISVSIPTIRHSNTSTLYYVDLLKKAAESISEDISTS